MGTYITNDSNMESLIHDKDFMEARHDNYDLMIQRWNFYLRSYLGGEEYRAGSFLHEYRSILVFYSEYHQLESMVHCLQSLV